MGYKIRKFRLERKLTQEELAAKAGVTRATICKIENGTQEDIKVKNLKKIAEALGVKLSELVD